jgi:hypothetical protein
VSTPQDAIYDPYNWLPSMFRTLKEYVLDGVDKSRKHFTENIGLQAYEIVFDFPAARLDPHKLPFTNENNDIVTLIHFEIDNIDNQPLGFGEGRFRETPYSATGTIVPEEAESHEVNFDVGIWATDSSGGSTSRLEAYGILDSLFSGPSAQSACQSLTGGVLIRSFGGGRFINDSVNDIRLYRVADVELVCHVYSSKLVVSETDSEIILIPELLIDETVIVDVQP